MPYQIAVVLFATLLLVIASCTAPSGTLLKSDFHRNPFSTGWRMGGAWRNQPFAGNWLQPDDDRPGHIVARAGHWESPPAPNSPFEYFRLTFRSKAQSKAYSAAFFYDPAREEPFDADCYDSVLPSDRWREQVRCFRGHPLADRVRIRFQAIDAPLAVAQVSLQRISRDAGAAWADELYATLPQLTWTPPAGRWRLIPNAMDRLRQGRTLRVVLLGDSIANDTSHSLFDVWVERAYPGSRVEVVNTVRGGTGCSYYREAGRLRSYVLRHRPHLVIIAGISHGYQTAPICDVIRQLRSTSAAEVMVASGCICAASRMKQNFIKYGLKSGERTREESSRIADTWLDRLAELARDEGVEYLDLRSAWESYIAASPRPQEWFLRDPVHANIRGKLVVGRMLLRYFQP
jgi:hypothetical protein